MNLLNYKQQPIEEVFDDEKPVRKSPPESDKSKERERDVSLSMAPLPIPLGPLGGKFEKSNFVFACGLYLIIENKK